MRSLPPLMLVSSLVACSGAPARGPVAENYALQPCPAAPHCVNSTATDEAHAVPPFRLAATGVQAWDQVVAVVVATERTTIVAGNDRYLHAECLSPWHIYTDDLELLLSEDGLRIDVRSSSRVGYYDFKVNRKRVEALRSKLAGLGLLAD